MRTHVIVAATILTALSAQLCIARSRPDNGARTLYEAVGHDINILPVGDGKPWHVQGPHKPWSIARSSNYDCYRFEVRNGDEWTGDHGETNAGDFGRTPARDRSELNGGYAVKMQFETAYWQAMDIMVEPPATGGFSQAQNVVAQWHNSANPGDAFSAPPNLSFEFDPNATWIVKIAGNRNDTTNPKFKLKRVFQGRYDFGHFYHYVLKMKFSRANDGGALTVWRDGEEIFSGTGLPMGYAPDKEGVYSKIGWYRYRSAETGVAHFCNVTNPTTTDLTARVPRSGWLPTPGPK